MKRNMITFFSLLGLCSAIVLDDDLHPNANINPSEIPWSIVNYDGSDVDATDGTIFHEADWAPECDPWKTDSMDLENAYNTPYASLNGDWICPEEWRSMSGCGDFLDDPRADVCEERQVLDECSDQRVIKESQPLVTMFHSCVQHPIHYINDYSTSDGSDTPPMVGRHRERWPVYGEYEFLPKQRWLHAAEHGAMIFLYDPCISEQTLCQLRQYITSVGAKLQPDLYETDTGGRAEADAFRYVLSPYKNLRKPIAIISWGFSFFSSCVNQPGMDAFITKHYRQAWEDWPPSGAYSYLHMGYTKDNHNDACPALTEYAWREDSSKTLYETNAQTVTSLAMRLEELERRMLELEDARRRLRSTRSEVAALRRELKLKDDIIGDLMDLLNKSNDPNLKQQAMKLAARL